MKSRLSFLIFSLLVILHANFAWSQSSKITGRVDSLFAEWNKPGKPGAAVGVVYQGKLVYAKGFGESDVETGTKINSQTIFHVASVSKQFTAYAIVLLAEQGKLLLDDDIRKYIPEVPDFGKTITIRHLIHHTSGLRDQWNLLAMAGWRLDDVITKEQVFNLIKRQKDLNFEPGSAYAYCNTGYTLLAEIVARVSKKSFPDFMQQTVFKPLGMKNSLFYDDHEKIVKGRAYSFHKSSGSSDVFGKSVLSYANVGVTSLFTTVDDLAFWIGNFRSPKVGTEATMKQMLERGILTKGDTLSYAFGLSHGKYKGLPYYGHNGADAGFRSSITFFPKEDYGFIVLSNLADFNPEKKAFEVASLYLSAKIKQEKPAPAPVSAVSPKVYNFDSTLFKSYAGAYELAEAPGFILNFRREGSRYFTQATGQGEVEMYPSSDSTFFLTVVEAPVIFHRAKEGKTERLTLKQNGERAAKRVNPAKAPEIKVGQFAGKYYSPELETLYAIETKGDTLKLIHVHHGEVNLRILNKDKLQAPWWFVQTIDVVRDSADQIIGLRMSNGRVSNLWLKRLPDDFAAGEPPLIRK